MCTVNGTAESNETKYATVLVALEFVGRIITEMDNDVPLYIVVFLAFQYDWSKHYIKKLSYYGLNGSNFIAVIQELFSKHKTINCN